MEIKFDHVDYQYKKINYKDKEVLKGINITFQESKINALVGFGKTTLLHLIIGMLKPTSGKLYIDQKDITSIEPSSISFDIGFLYQNPEEYFSEEIVSNELELQLKRYHYHLNEKKKRVLSSLIMVGLDESFLNKKICHLSSSEKRKLSLASALILNPKCLILDEPTSNMDKEFKKMLIKLLRMLKKRYKKTIVIASNDTDFLLQIADYVYVLADQKIVLEGKNIDVFKMESVFYKYHISVPKIIDFENLVLKKKNIKLGYRNDINDLIKDIYRNY